MPNHPRVSNRATKASSRVTGVNEPEGDAGPGVSPMGAESLDSPSLDAAVARATLADIARANALFGGRAAVAFGLARLLGDERRGRTVLLLDVGAGKGDVLQDLRRRWRRLGVELRTVAIDYHREAARLCRDGGHRVSVGDARQLPVADSSVDIVIASQMLHHFNHATAVRLIREFDRVARFGVIIADLRRARLAGLGIWIASYALRFHEVTRQDGVVSVRRGFTRSELRQLLGEAGVTATVFSRPGFRLVASWRTADAHR